MNNNIKNERLQSLILRDLTLILQREFHDDEIISKVIIHEVKLASDYSHCKIFYSSLTPDVTKEELEEVLADVNKSIRQSLAGKLEIYRTPELIWQYDTLLENANKIEDILKSSKK